ncbi:hypothetical protein, partial [uncultured Eubacterium sp.]|uniref:hypothetical protein n=1 Tax=uncultured Eubacterium sp. TaxID=165185 RepID=UPI003263643E
INGKIPCGILLVNNKQPFILNLIICINLEFLWDYISELDLELIYDLINDILDISTVCTYKTSKIVRQII